MSKVQVYKLAAMTKGWFIGNFQPTLLATEGVEVAVKEYPAGFAEAWHYHKIATEFTVIVSGEVKMNGVHYTKGDIIVMPPGEGTDFQALTDVVTTVVKIPGATNDKFLRPDRENDERVFSGEAPSGAVKPDPIQPC